MTDDLVKRLRSPEVFRITSGMISPVAEAAAERIEKLEAALRYVYSEVKDEYGFALVEEKILAALSWEKKYE